MGAGAGGRVRPWRRAILFSTREQEVLAEAARGLRNKEIAARLGISDEGVRYHLKNIYRKAGVSKRADAVKYADPFFFCQDSPTLVQVARWGYSSAAPNGPQLRTLARKLAYFNEYSPGRLADFVTLTAGAAGTGEGKVIYTVARNAGGPRTGILTVSGQRVTVFRRRRRRSLTTPSRRG